MRESLIRTTLHTARAILKFKLINQNSVSGKNCAILFEIKGPENHLKDIVTHFCQQTLAPKLGCQQAAIQTSAVVLWLLFGHFLTNFNKTNSV